MNEKKKSSKDSDDSPLDYIKINQKNIIEELTSKDYIAVTSNLLKSFSMIEDHIGAEINKFFNILLPESKNNDQLQNPCALWNHINCNKTTIAKQHTGKRASPDPIYKQANGNKYIQKKMQGITKYLVTVNRIP